MNKKTIDKLRIKKLAVNAVTIKLLEDSRLRFVQGGSMVDNCQSGGANRICDTRTQ